MTEEEITVQNKDMALLFVVFNPCKTKRIIMNYLYCTNEFKRQGLPIFTIELVFEGREPELMDAIHVRGSSHMFHKERLCRILETHIPPQFTKLAFLDADLLFSTPTWYHSVSELLNTHDVVHPFEDAVWLDLTYTCEEQRRKSIVLLDKPVFHYTYHPGFAWCMRRDWYNKIGFFDWAISGSGDTLSTAGWLKKSLPDSSLSLPRGARAAYSEFVKQESPRITCLKGVTVYHLYHGTKNNRQYASRHKLLDINEDIRTLIKFNSDGVYEWIDPTRFNQLYLEYFTSRFDDDISGFLK